MTSAQTTPAEEDGPIDLVSALGLATSGELIAIVGGGGKSALLFALAQRLPGRSVLTTTTRIFAAQTALAREVVRANTPELRAALERGVSGLLIIGEIEGEKARGVASELPAGWLARPDVDFVVVEADGSRMRPTKAPASHEPVIPKDTTLVVVVAGIDALEGTIAECCHRPERVARIVGLAEDQPLTPAAFAALLCDEHGGRQGVPQGARTALLLNKVESAHDRDRARDVARRVVAHGAHGRVLIGALQRAERGFEVMT